MPKLLLSQTNFNKGEISPRLYGRFDKDEIYKNALETADNAYVTPYGPILRRAGFKYIAEVKTSSKKVRLVSFQERGDASYVIEMGDTYARFFTLSGQVESGGSPYEIASPYTEAQIANITWVQYDNKIYFAHPDVTPRVLTRTSSTNWAFSELDALPPPSYEAGHSPASNLTLSATSGTAVTVTAAVAGTFIEGDIGRQLYNTDGSVGRGSITAFTSSTQVTINVLETFASTSISSGNWSLDLTPVTELTPSGTKVGSIITIDSDAIGTTTARDAFRSTDVGKYILLNGGVCQIVTVTSGNQVSCEVLKSLTSLDESSNWTLESDSWDGTRGYPAVVGLHQERLVFANTTAQPQTIWLSEVGLFDSFGIGAQDDDSIEVDITARERGEITWLSTLRELIVGTSNSEVTLNGGSPSAPLTPTSINSIVRDYSGGDIQQPVSLGEEVLYVHRSLRKLNSFQYDFNIDGYATSEVTFLAKHLTENNLVEAVFCQEPDNIIYVVDAAGKLLAGTYKKDDRVIGWCSWDTDGEVERLTTIPRGSVDQLWVVVKRTINGTTKRYIELLESGDGTVNTHGFSDSFLIHSNPQAISGITTANPAVVTCSSSHGFSDGDTVKLIGVGGMTEVNNITYKVAKSTSTTFELESNSPLTNLVDGSTYQWTASGSGTSEYYLEAAGGGDPGLSEPISLYESGSLLTIGTAGSLSASEWDWADNDTLGYSTVYVRTSGSVDPDSLLIGVIQYGVGVDSSAYSAYTSGGNAHELITSLTGLSHLEGKTIQLKVNGATHPSKTVSSGSVTLDLPAYEVVAGLSYTTTIKTLRANYSLALGNMQGQQVRWVRPQIRVYNSTLPTLNGTLIPSRDSSDRMDQSVPLYSGDLDYGNIGWDNKGQLTFTVSSPLPLQIQAIFGTAEGGVL